MPTLEKTRTQPHLNEILQLVLDDASSAQEERRINGRIPFFQPAVLELEDSGETFSIFTRDVAPIGIGLLHWMPLAPQDVNLLINLSSGEVVRFRIEILWCVECGGGWYISGGGFQDATFIEGALHSQISE